MTNNIQEYIAIIDQENSSQLGVIFPDFLGCITIGKNLQEARKMAHQALQFHIDGMVEDGEDLPEPLTLDKIKKKYKNAKIFLVVKIKKLIPIKS